MNSSAFVSVTAEQVALHGLLQGLRRLPPQEQDFALDRFRATLQQASPARVQACKQAMQAELAALPPAAAPPEAETDARALAEALYGAVLYAEDYPVVRPEPVGSAATGDEGPEAEADWPAEG